MAASQARLLSITARLTNNENSGQSVSYSKQRLADQTQQITNEYNEALDATKLTVLTGFNGAQANYEDISYKLMTGMQMAENTKQYVVTDTKGKVLVTENIANAYKKSNGNYNQFLASMGYSQADITVQKTYTDVKDRTTQQENAEQQIHEAWDKYFESVGINKFMPEHDLGISWTETVAQGGDINNPDDYNIGDGYAGFKRAKTDENGNIIYKQKQKVDENGNAIYNQKPKVDENGNTIYNQKPKVDENGKEVKDENGNPVMVDDKDNPVMVDDLDNPVMVEDLDNPEYELDQNGDYIYDPINYEGTTDEQRELYDYAMALTEAYLRVGEGENGKKFNKEYDIESTKSASNSDNASALKYYRNLFTKMQSSGYFTYTETPAKANEDPEHFKYTSKGTGTAGNVAKSPLDDNTVFEAALRDGSLRLEYYSSTDKAFKSTTISEDNCIQEVADERAIAKAEAKYTQDMADLENKDKKLDLELKKLDTEHSALQTEYESVKNVVDKNVEASFKTFG